ncbi:hypothetical protein C0993_007410 [Termitomyces sp. T159_Od127]|nr:hypothetical protein C0993_007410 [Termitomyces sp. T159_Od127]
MPFHRSSSIRFFRNASHQRQIIKPITHPTPLPDRAEKDVRGCIQEVGNPHRELAKLPAGQGETFKQPDARFAELEKALAELDTLLKELNTITAGINAADSDLGAVAAGLKAMNVKLDTVATEFGIVDIKFEKPDRKQCACRVTKSK